MSNTRPDNIQPPSLCTQARNAVDKPHRPDDVTVLPRLMNHDRRSSSGGGGGGGGVVVVDEMVLIVVVLVEIVVLVDTV